MDIYFKTIGGAMIGLILWLCLSSAGKDFTLLLGVMICCLVSLSSMIFLEPIIEFYREMAGLIPMDSELLEILLKAVGIGILGELASAICTDSGNSALGKALQLLTGVLLLWMTLPMLRSLLELIRQFLEAVG